jgi:PAS domain S-box-containing protein
LEEQKEQIFCLLVKMECRDELFRELVENSEDIFIVADRELKIQYASSSVTKVLGVEIGFLLGKNILDFIESEKLHRWDQSLKKGEDHITDEVIFTDGSNHEVYFDVSVSKLFHEEKAQGLALKLYNVTSQKLREQELIRSNQQLDQVIYKTTHDLKAPIMSALGLVKIAEQASYEEQSLYLGMIKKSLLRLDSFIEEMNNFYRNEKLALHREKIDLENMLSEELDNLKNLYPDRSIDISWNIGGNAELLSDKVRVQTIITNILSNAIKYMDLQKQNPFIKIAAQITEEVCDIQVEDNGIGIAQAYQEKIFDLFFRATDQGQGTGLGLFIVKDTIDRLKGTINVQSKIGEGTIFKISIPNQLYQPIEIE